MGHLTTADHGSEGWGFDASSDEGCFRYSASDKSWIEVPVDLWLIVLILLVLLAVLVVVARRRRRGGGVLATKRSRR